MCFCVAAHLRMAGVACQRKRVFSAAYGKRRQRFENQVAEGCNFII